jgi:methylated-DNA-[protein]-cysteine S-methyltransferase
LIWRELQNIPYGETATYGQIAKKIGKPLASQAVGSAIGKNPIPIIIPCHRVIGSNGKLRGFSGGINTKELLLNLEREKS